MAKKSKKPDKSDQKYLTTGLLLSAGGLGLALLTYVIWLFGGIEAFAYRILLLVPIGAVVLLIGCFRTVSEKGTGTFCSAEERKMSQSPTVRGGGSILKWMFGDKIEWD